MKLLYVPFGMNMLILVEVYGRSVPTGCRLRCKGDGRASSGPVTPATADLISYFGEIVVLPLLN